MFLHILDARAAVLKKSLDTYSCAVIPPFLSADGRFALTAMDTAEVWDLQSGQRSCVLEGSGDGMPCAAAFSPDNTLVLCACYSGTLALWDTRTGKKLRDLSTNSQRGTVAAFSADGNRCAVAFENGTASIFDLRSNSAPVPLAVGGATIRDLCFSTDGSALAGAPEQASAYVWDVQSGAILSTLPAKQNVRSVAFSPDGRWLLFVAGEQAEVWNWRDQEPRGVLNGAFNFAAFDGMNSRIISDNMHGEVLHWSLRRDPSAWGVLALPEFWLTVVLAGALAWSVRRDRDNGA